MRRLLRHRGFTSAILAAALAVPGGCSTCSEPARIDPSSPAPGTDAPETVRPETPAPRTTKSAPLVPASGVRPDFDALARPHVRLTDVHIEGTLEAARARAAVEARLGEADACFAARLKDKPSLRGTVEVRVAFPATPRGGPLLTGAASASHTGGDLVLQDCVSNAFARWPESALDAPETASVLRFRFALYRGLELPATMPSLPPPPKLPPPGKTAPR